MGAGRKRDERIDTAAIDAVRELLLETGYAKLSMATVAERAHTTKTALYRRWSGKAELVHDATFSTVQQLAPSSGDVIADIRAMVEISRELFSDPVTRASLPALVAETGSDSALSARVHGKFAEVFGQVRERIVEAVGRGELHPEVDPDRLIELMGGAAILRALIVPAGPGEPIYDDDWVDNTTALLLHGIGPAGGIPKPGGP